MKSKLIKGFTHLTSLSALSSGIGFISVIVIISIIGINEYGKFSGAFAFFLFFELLVKQEIKLVLVKYDYNLKSTLYHSALSLLLVVSICLVVVFIGFTLLIPETINPYNEFTFPLLTLLFILPVSVITEIPRADLERRMKFELISRQEFTAGLLQHTVGISLAVYLESYVALIIGWFVYNISISFFSWSTSDVLFQIEIKKKHINSILKHSKHIFFQNILFETRRLVNPLVVGYLIGADGVGLISFTEKMVYGLSFFKNSLRRVTISMLGSLTDKKQRIQSSVKQATLLQLLPLGAILLVASIILYVLAYLSNDLFWTNISSLYPFLAIGFFYSVILVVPITALQMNEGYKQVTLYLIIFNFLFIACSIIGVRYIGIIGYGLVEIVVIPAYYILFRSTESKLGDVLSDTIIILMICITIALMWSYIGWVALISIIILFLVPELLKEYKQIYLLFKE